MCVTWGHMGLGHGHGHSRGGGRNGGRGGWHDGAAGAMWRSAVWGVVEREGGRVVGKEALDVVERVHGPEKVFDAGVPVFPNVVVAVEEDVFARVICRRAVVEGAHGGLVCSRAEAVAIPSSWGVVCDTPDESSRERGASAEAFERVRLRVS